MIWYACMTMYYVLMNIELDMYIYIYVSVRVCMLYMGFVQIRMKGMLRACPSPICKSNRVHQKQMLSR